MRDGPAGGMDTVPSRPRAKGRRAYPRRSAAGIGRALAQRHGDGLLAGAACDSDLDLRARRLVEQRGNEVAAIIDSCPVHRDDDIALLEAGGLGWALARRVVGEVTDLHTTLHWQVEGAGELRCHILALDAEEALAGVDEPAVLDELVGDELHAVGWNGKADAVGG